MYLYALNKSKTLEKVKCIGSGHGFYTVRSSSGIEKYRGRNLYYLDGVSVSGSARAFGTKYVENTHGDVRIFYHREGIKIKKKSTVFWRRVFGYVYHIPGQDAGFINHMLDDMELNTAAKWLIEL